MRTHTQHVLLAPKGHPLSKCVAEKQPGGEDVRAVLGGWSEEEEESLPISEQARCGGYVTSKYGRHIHAGRPVLHVRALTLRDGALVRACGDSK